MTQRLPRLPSLTARLLLLALVQGLAIFVLAVAIAAVSRPEHPDPHPPSRRAATQRPHKERPPLSHWGPQLTLALMLLVLLGGSVLLGSWLLPPLRAMRRAASRLGAGDFSARADLARRDEIGELGQAFDDMAAKVQQMMRAERTLLANVSHELRTPLARIRVAVELIEDGDTAMAQAALRDITQDLTEMESLIDDILAAARLEGATTAAEEVFTNARTPVDPAVLIEHAARRFNARHPQRRVITQAPTHPLPTLSVHLILLRRALENLLENAHKYTPDPHAAIILQADWTPAPPRVIFSVADRGDGIPDAEQQRLFDPFFRGAESKHNVSGLGLGLTLVQRIVLAHAGAVTVESAPGQGTIVSIALPVAPDP